MIPAQFDYARANSIDEALTLLAQNEDAKILAGGHSLIPAMKLRLTQPPLLVDNQIVLESCSSPFGVRRQSEAATALWIMTSFQDRCLVSGDPKRCRRFALPPHSKFIR